MAIIKRSIIKIIILMKNLIMVISLIMTINPFQVRKVLKNREIKYQLNQRRKLRAKEMNQMGLLQL